MKRIVGAMVLCAVLSSPVRAEETLTVALSPVRDEKAVFATIESANVVPARVRTGGTIAELKVGEGDRVEAGQEIAVVGDEKLAIQTGTLDSRIAGLRAEVGQAKTVLKRVKELHAKGIVSQARLDEAETAHDVAVNALNAGMSERNVVGRQVSEGAVIAPVPGRVLSVPVTAGTVVMQGETVAMIADEHYVLRLRVPERHARFLKAGDEVRLDLSEMGAGEASRIGKISVVYPQIEDGRVIADAVVERLGDYFVGERVRVWISGGVRQAVVVPARYLSTRFGMDYARLRLKDGKDVEVAVQRGQTLPLEGMEDGVEILSGLAAGDVLVQP